jgi:hypothetical protein
VKNSLELIPKDLIGVIIERLMIFSIFFKAENIEDERENRVAYIHLQNEDVPFIIIDNIVRDALVSVSTGPLITTDLEKKLNSFLEDLKIDIPVKKSKITYWR